MDMFWLNHEQLLKGVNLGFQRYLSRQVKWDRRLIGIFGAKGVGKTTPFVAAYQIGLYSTESA